jgi:hypothetical protein
MDKFKIGDEVIVSDAASLNHGAYATVSGTGSVYGYDEVLVELDRDGTTHKFDASQLTPLDQPVGGGVWEDPAVRRAVRETIAESEAGR